jgi:hypothetical protein
VLDLGYPRATTNKKNFVDLAILKASFIHGLLHRSHGLAEEVIVRLL